MTIVDLVKARAYADAIDDETAAEWIRELADEVASQEGALELLRRQYGEMKQLAHHREGELDVAVTTLKVLYSQIGTMIKDLS